MEPPVRKFEKQTKGVHETAFWRPHVQVQSKIDFRQAARKRRAKGVAVEAKIWWPVGCQRQNLVLVG